MNSAPLKQKAGVVFKHWSELVVKPWRIPLEYIVNVIGHGCLPVNEVKLLPSHRGWETGVISPLVITFERHGSHGLEKDILGYKTARD